MGERPADDWADELRRTGQVVFPLRRRPMLWQLGLGIVALAAYIVPAQLLGTTADRHAVAVGLSVYVLFMLIGIWQFITQRPAITVDREGIRRGRRQLIHWNEIAAIGPTTGLLWTRALPIVPRSSAHRHLRLSRMNVRDLPTFRLWLDEVLGEQSRSESSR
ncbi:hypothetical protein [Kribbella sp. NPDC004536]|uniref:hypothetical protein n=1 Tax=Kribbella sp. NPDC004536 TaxID=3364106 RepID=UPI0036B3A95A